MTFVESLIPVGYAMAFVFAVINLVYLTRSILLKRKAEKAKRVLNDYNKFILETQRELTKKTDYAVMAIIESKINRVMSAEEFRKQSVKVYDSPFPGSSTSIIGLRTPSFNPESFSVKVDVHEAIRDPYSFFEDIHVEPIARIYGSTTKEVLTILVEDLTQNIDCQKITIEIPKEFQHDRFQ